jgi:hypothetical protein
VLYLVYKIKGDGLMTKQLKDFTHEELLDYLGLETDAEVLDRDGIEIPVNVASNVLEKLRALRFGDIRGHIAVEGLANISYSEDRRDNRFLNYDYYEKIIRTGDAVIKIDKCENIKIFVSYSNWIDFFFDTPSARVTTVLVP